MFDYNRDYADDLEASGPMTLDRVPKFSYHFFRTQRDAAQKRLGTRPARSVCCQLLAVRFEHRCACVWKCGTGRAIAERSQRGATAARSGSARIDTLLRIASPAVEGCSSPAP
jgi:hypothetical protein